MCFFLFQKCDRSNRQFAGYCLDVKTVESNAQNYKSNQRYICTVGWCIRTWKRYIYKTFELRVFYVYDTLDNAICEKE